MGNIFDKIGQVFSNSLDALGDLGTAFSKLFEGVGDMFQAFALWFRDNLLWMREMGGEILRIFTSYANITEWVDKHFLWIALVIGTIFIEWSLSKVIKAVVPPVIIPPPIQ
jgi:phage-related protein